MKISTFRLLSLSLLPLAISSMGCKSERVAVGPIPPREQEITRFESKISTADPVVFGQVKLIDQKATYALSTAIISLNEKIFFTDETGNYRLNLKPGLHKLMSGQIGIHQSRLILNVEQGDSVRINFYLRPDLRPLN